jgi:hypothetical protein
MTIGNARVVTSRYSGMKKIKLATSPRSGTPIVVYADVMLIMPPNGRIPWGCRPITYCSLASSGLVTTSLHSVRLLMRLRKYAAGSGKVLSTVL